MNSVNKNNLIIYEIFPRVYSEKGNFRGIVEDIERICSLGINTVWLMPVYPIGQKNRKGSLGSPYAVKNHYEINPEYGDKNDFRKLVEEFHKRDIYVIIDWETNYTAWDHPWIEEHNDWYVKDENGNIVLPNIEWWDVARLDFSREELVKEMIAAMKYWIDEFDIDGFRCDMAGDMAGREPSKYWAIVRGELEKLKRDIIMIAEWDEAKFYPAFDFCYDWKLYTLFKDILHYKETPFKIGSILEKEKEIYPFASRLRFIENHDERRAYEIFGERFSFVFASIIFSLPGAILIYNGQEIGSTSHPTLFDEFTINWKAEIKKVADFYKKLISIRKQSDVLAEGEVISFKSEVFGFKRVFKNKEFLFLWNFYKDYKEVNLDGKYMDLIDNKKLEGKVKFKKEEFKLLDKV